MTSPNITFWTGTDTDVGKTYCAVQNVRQRVQHGESVGVCKPVASGARRIVSADGQVSWLAEDADALWRAAGRPGDLAAVCPQCFEDALSPPMAAAKAGTSVDQDCLIDAVMNWASDASFDHVVIEGAGGLFSPIADDWLNVDLILELKNRLPGMRVVLVGVNRLGVQHQVIAATRAAQAAGCGIDAVWLNTMDPEIDGSVTGNAEELRRWLDVPILDPSTTKTARAEETNPNTLPWQ